MPNPLLLFAAQIVAILSVLLLAAGYLKTEPKATSARVFAVMAIFIVFYLVIGMSGPNIDPQFRVDLTGWRLLLLFGINAICGLFMIYCFLIFQEQSSFPKPLAAAFGMQVVIDLILSYLAVDSTAQEPAAAAVFLSFFMDVLQLVFVCLAIFWTLKGWRTDLVEDRRVFRWFIIGLQGALIFSVVFVENFLLAGGSASYASEQAVIVYAIAVLTLGMLLAALRFDFVSLSYVIRRVTELTEEKSGQGTEAIDEESFNRVFRDGLLYREAGLTISGLAKKLNMPEYRLRAFIHKQLGFRNFNAMLHKYRIEDASAALADSSKQNLPVLTIALSVGYQSITPFNNAFREIKGVTPSEYRKKMQD